MRRSHSSVNPLICLNLENNRAKSQQGVNTFHGAVYFECKGVSL